MKKYLHYFVFCFLALGFFLMGSAHAQERVEKGKQVSLEYTLMIDGQEVETTKDAQPLVFEPGEQMLIPGLEKELLGMKVGEEKTVRVFPEEAYGERDDALQREFERSQFPAEIESMLGQVIDMQDEQGNAYPAVIARVSSEQVLLDFNHPLAGRTLNFDVKIVGIEDIQKK